MTKDKPQAKKPQTHNKRPFSIGAFFGRFHAVIFFVIVCGSLTAAVYMLSTVINNSSAPAGYAPPSTNATFDTDTIERVEELRDLNTPPPPLQLPVGERSNPFAG